MRGNILVIDDETRVAAELEDGLQGQNIYHVSNLLGVGDQLRTKNIDIAFVDLNLTGSKKSERFSGLSYVKKLRERFPDLYIIVLSGYHEVSKVVTAIKNGANDYIYKGEFDPDDLGFKKRIGEIVKNNRLLAERKKKAFRTIVGHSPQTQKMREQLKAYAKGQKSFILILPNGTPKENYLYYTLGQSHFAHKKEPLLHLYVGTDHNLEQVYNEKEELLQLGSKEFKSSAKKRLIVLHRWAHLPMHLQEVLFAKLSEGAEAEATFHARIPSNLMMICRISDMENISANLPIPRLQIVPLGERSADIPPLIDQWKTLQNLSSLKFTEEASAFLNRYHYQRNEKELFGILDLALANHKAVMDSDIEETPITVDKLPAKVCNQEQNLRDMKKALAEEALRFIERALQLHQGKKGEAALELALSPKNKEETDLKKKKKRAADILKKTYIDPIWDDYPELFRQFPMILKSYKLDVPD
ncbi:MAG: response regulator [Bacteroidota bacterium]